MHNGRELINYDILRCHFVQLCANMAVSADCFGPYPVWHLIWLFHIRSRESESDHPIKNDRSNHGAGKYV